MAGSEEAMIMIMMALDFSDCLNNNKEYVIGNIIMPKARQRADRSEKVCEGELC